MTENSTMGSSSTSNARPKRQVNYNPDAILCPDCKKRIRLNNNGRVRLHIRGKTGSPNCVGSDALPAAKDQVKPDYSSPATSSAEKPDHTVLLEGLLLDEQ